MIDRSAGYVDLLGNVESVLDATARGARHRPVVARSASRTRVAAGGRTSARPQQGSGAQPILGTLATLEALGSILVARLVARAPGTPVAPFAAILAGAGEADELHARALGELGGRPSTTRFWIPDALLSGTQGLDTLAAHQEIVISAYLTAIAAAARSRDAKTAARLAEMLGTACEHRVLARFAAAVAGGARGAALPNDRAFQAQPHTSPAAALGAARRLGFGIGEAAAGEGRFHEPRATTPSPPGVPEARSVATGVAEVVAANDDVPARRAG